MVPRIGRCQLEATRPAVDVRNVIWLATSNIGDSLVFEHHDARVDPSVQHSREEYVKLMAAMRASVSERLGVSNLS
jgi:hypothetical protein